MPVAYASGVVPGQVVRVLAHAGKERQALVLEVSAGRCTVAWCTKGQLRQLRVGPNCLRGILAEASSVDTAANPVPGARHALAVSGQVREATVVSYRKNGRVIVHFRDGGTPPSVEMSVRELRAAVGFSPLPAADPGARGPIPQAAPAPAKRAKPRKGSRSSSATAAPVRTTFAMREPRPERRASTGPVRNTKPVDVFPIGSVVEFESGGAVRRGEVRRTISASEVVVAFRGPGGVVSRPMLRHRLTLVP